MYTKYMRRHFKKVINPHYWLLFLRKQSKHVQKMYVTIISGSITLVIACVILYVDYGFWHERYKKDEEVILLQKEQEKPESPSQMMSRFLGEARSQFKTINVSPSKILEGKETYTNDDQ